MLGVYNKWTGLVDWTSGLDYWTGKLTTKILYTSVSSFLVPLPLSHGLHGTLGIGKGKPFEAHMLTLAGQT